MRPVLTLHDPQAARSYYKAGLWQDETFYQLAAKHAERAADTAALRDGLKRLTWTQLLAAIDAMANDMAGRGIVAGDRVSLWMGNRIEAIVTFLACSRLGVACNPSLHRTHTCAEIVTLLNELGAKALLTQEGWGADRKQSDFVEMLKDVPSLKVVYDVDALASIGAPEVAVHENPDSVAYLAFTSGTTGRPKCVMHSSNTLLANGRDLVRDWALDDTAVIYSISPLSHHIAWVGIAQWLVCGGEFVTDHPADGMSRIDWIIETGATYCLGVPTHAMDILAEQESRKIERLGNVQIFYMAGSPIPEVVAQAFVNQGITPQNIYGMTECSSHQYTHPDDSQETWVSTCGRGGPGYEVKIWDPENPDQEVAQGEAGEIGGRGAVMMLGYFANQAATEKTFNAHGYLMSGDLGAFDDKGNLRIVGRAKDIIIRGGHNIYPSTIEACAIAHSEIEKAAAFPIKDDRLGEKVCLAVIGNVEADAMLQHLDAEGLSKFDMPEWYIVVEELPLTASGKILKRELTKMVEAGALVPQPVRFKARS